MLHVGNDKSQNPLGKRTGNGRKTREWTVGLIVLAGLVSVPVSHAKTPPAGTVVQAGSVRKNSRRLALEAASKRAQLRIPVAQKVLGRQEIRAAGPAAGAAQALAIAPGVAVSSYGNGGPTKFSFSINGIKQGWGGPSGGTIDDGSLAVNFDGIPMNNVASGLWQSPEVNQLEMIQNIAVTYGPGEPADRWYDNIGGAIDFVPVQPGPNAGFKVSLLAGSDATRGFYIQGQSGRIDGWETVLAGGVGHQDSFRSTPDGFSSPGHDYAWFFKTRHRFATGSVSFGAYTAYGQAFRPNVVPVQPIAGVTVNGLTAAGAPIPGPLYSQATTGFYGALPYSVWNKNDANRTYLFYIRSNLALSSDLGFHTELWYRYGSRFHFHDYNFQQDQPNRYEYNNPHGYAYGDRAYFSLLLPANDIKFGAFWITSKYNSKNAFYNPLFGGSNVAPNGSYRSDIWQQNVVALFAQDEIHLPDRFTLTPGLRFVHYGTDYYVYGSADFPNATGHDQAALPSSSTSLTGLEPSLFANWRFLPGWSVYANYSTSYRQPQSGGGGGPYQQILASSLQLEEGVEKQVGVKYRSTGGPLGAFFAGLNYYYLTYSNQIISISSANGQYLVSAFGSSHYDGVNLFVDDDPIPDVHLFANLSFEHAVFNNYTVGGVNYSGLPVSNTPNRTFNLGGSWHVDVNSWLTLTPRLWVTENGAEYLFSNLKGAPTRSTQPAYTIWNAAVRIGLPRIHPLHSLRLDFTVLNLFNREYNTTEYFSSGGYFVVPQSQGALLAYPGAPRTAYVTLTASF